MLAHAPERAVRGSVLDSVRGSGFGGVEPFAGALNLGQVSRRPAQQGTNSAAPEAPAQFMAGIERVAEELGLPQPLGPVSVVGVNSLFEPDVLVELEAYAVLDQAAPGRTVSRAAPPICGCPSPSITLVVDATIASRSEGNAARCCQASSSPPPEIRPPRGPPAGPAASSADAHPSTASLCRSASMDVR
jgi:hypothetical protein